MTGNTIRSGLLLTLLFLGACAATPQQPPCPGGQQNLPDCPPEDAVRDLLVETHYQRRRRADAEALDIDPIKLGMETEVPANIAQGKIIGSSYQESINSLATKIWLIDNARYSVDAVYYIFSRDLVGYAFLGALCDAVQRGVDIRIMVDALGSFHSSHSELKALRNCAIDGGFAVNKLGQTTTTKARVQAVVFGALTQSPGNINRRSHDKLLVVDGANPDLAWVMTGGRNISLSYYGLREDGSRDPSAYKDLEILLRSPPNARVSESVGQISEHYISILLAHSGNKVLRSGMAYNGQIRKMRDSLAALRAMPDFQQAYDSVEGYLQQDLYPTRVRIAHELGNITNTDVVSQYDENLKKNPNSIIYITSKLSALDADNRTMRIVSPYLFVPKYERDDGDVYHDGSKKVQEWLQEHPDNRIEIVTNSVLTSDNFFAQAIIDMDTAPSLLLDREAGEQWQKKLSKSELNPELVESEQWQQLINNPRVRIYQTGKLDADVLGGDVAYGKLHAKFFLADRWGFVGTTNLDYRSRLYNNEMGFFFDGEALHQELLKEFEALKAQSYLWGSPEWLQMRAAVRDMRGMKGRTTSNQRDLFTDLLRTGLHWQF
ncbi:phospholipase D-like domain-containing protein [Pseudohalioglobus lutimaris]|uniref:Phospholipase n=1 Tax=Pseudohalioglobus lutimaris TaxID=1737061 RepID=A0A2N5WY59_9GAMM|nr:phospholipase D-like domain-containing protein [Pseudohalioglobus lutimaris]PLW67171.1 phospholipase [Pseudohalioglobus lutimaris]